MTKIDKKIILKRLNDFGYNFSVLSPGRDFYIDYLTDDFRFRFSFNLNGGIIIPYIYIYNKFDTKVDFDYPNMIFTYKYLLNEIDKTLEASTVFCDYDEFDVIILSFINLFLDFKSEFLKIVRI